MDSNFQASLVKNSSTSTSTTNGVPARRSSVIHDNGSHSSSSGSRRSACDRCRAHKLRCVRPPGCDFLNEGAGGGLPACERCVKAGAECLHTVRTRQVSIRSSGYEQRSSMGSVSPPIVYQRPAADDALPPGGHMYQDTSTRPSYRNTPMPQCPGEGRAALAAVGGQQQQQHGRPSHGVRRQDSFHRSMAADPSGAADLSALGGGGGGGGFPGMVFAGVNAGVKSNPGGRNSNIPFGISDHDLSSLSHWPECDPALTNIFGQDLSDLTTTTTTNTTTTNTTTTTNAGPAKSISAPVVESNENPRATIRGPTTTITSDRCETKDECLQRLTELTSLLLKCFSLTEDHAVELEDLLAYSPRGRTRAAAAEAHEEDPETGKNMVGVLLESSQVFLDTLERLKGLQTPPRQDRQSNCSSPGSEYSYVDSPEEMDVFSNDGTANTHESLPIPHRRPEDEDGAGDGIDDLLKSPGVAPHPRSHAVTASILSPQHSGFFSMPTTFTIISCYMWLFRGYEAVFAAIHNALLTQKYQRHQCTPEASGSSSSGGSNNTNQRHGGKGLGPVILPDISIGGFGLNCHPHLQIEMLIHVSCQMLQRIEAVLGIDPASRESSGGCALADAQQQQNGVLNLASAPTLLHAFLHGANRGGGGEGPNSARLSLVRGIVKSIRHTLRGGRG